MEPILATVGLNYATTMHGAQCVMTSGEHLMLMWSVDNLDLLGQVKSRFEDANGLQQLQVNRISIVVCINAYQQITVSITTI